MVCPRVVRPPCFRGLAASLLQSSLRRYRQHWLRAPLGSPDGAAEIGRVKVPLCQDMLPHRPPREAVGTRLHSTPRPPRMSHRGGGSLLSAAALSSHCSLRPSWASLTPSTPCPNLRVPWNSWRRRRVSRGPAAEMNRRHIYRVGGCAVFLSPVRHGLGGNRGM